MSSMQCPKEGTLKAGGRVLCWCGLEAGRRVICWCRLEAGRRVICWCGLEAGGRVICWCDRGGSMIGRHVPSWRNQRKQARQHRNHEYPAGIEGPTSINRQGVLIFFKMVNLVKWHETPKAAKTKG